MRPLCRDHTLLYCSEKSRNIAHPLKAHHDHRRVLSRWRRREPSALAWCTYSRSSSSCTQVANMGKAGGSQECAKCPTELSWRVGQHIYKYKRIIIRPNERVRRLYGAFLNIRDLTIRELYIYIYIYGSYNSTRRSGTQTREERLIMADLTTFRYLSICIYVCILGILICRYLFLAIIIE